MHDTSCPHTFTRPTAEGPLALTYRDQGRGEPLLLVHGFFGSGADFQHLPGLAPGWRTIAPDLRGHGGSFSVGHPFCFRDAALDLIALLDALGVQRCRALGLSAGALTLLRLSVLQPARLTRMVLVSACAGFPPEARAFMRSHVGEARLREPAPSAREDALLATAQGFAEGLDDAQLTAAELAAITAPTLLVSGDRDPLYPLEVAHQLQRALPAAALWVIPGEGHMPVFGAARDELVRRAQAFLR